jgi:predicted nucleotidyltransferase
MKPITLYPQVNKAVKEILSHQKRILGEKIVGVYLYGSAATGDFNESISDIDLLCAVSSDLEKTEFEQLEQMHIDFANRNKTWLDRIEVEYLSLISLKTFKTQATDMADISPGTSFHTAKEDRLWLINWYSVQEKGITLFGLKPAQVIAPVPKEEFIAAVKIHIQSWPQWIQHLSKNRSSQALAIITLCRAYYSLKYTEQVPKVKAALWMQKQFPTWAPLIQTALTWRQEQVEDKMIEERQNEETIAFVQDVVTKTGL